MKNIKVLIMVLLSIILIGCGSDTAQKQSSKTTESENINKVEEDKNKEVEESKLEKDSMNNLIEDKNNINIVDNSETINNLDLRNNTIVKQYINAIKFYKDFSAKNNLNLTFVEPLKHRVSRFNVEGHENISVLLNELYISGAETVNYFTNQDGLNIDLSISIHRDERTYDGIIYKASIEKIDENFNFKESKLFEFRNGIIQDDKLDFNKINKFVKDSLSGTLNKDTIFFNKIDDDKYEVIRIEKGNCYYKLVYDPKL